MSRTHSPSVKRVCFIIGIYWKIYSYLSASIELENYFESWKKSLKFMDRPGIRSYLQHFI